jgi:hypothetical protein
MKFLLPIRTTSTPKMKETFEFIAGKTSFIQYMKCHGLAGNSKGVDPFMN